jgi:HemY protein
MIRIASALFLVSAIIVAAIALQGDPGSASLTWLGWRVDSTASAAVLIIGLLALAATFFWRALLWALQARGRAAQSAAEGRRRQGRALLTRGFLAAAAGDGAEARRLAQKAGALDDSTPQLVRLLAAQAAEAAGDPAAARAAYTAMLGFPDMRLAAQRGLMQTALAEGNAALALRHAGEAFDLPATAPWAWRALYASRLEEGDTAGALSLTQGARDRGVIAPLVADRAKAAAQAIAARVLAERSPHQALDMAQSAAKSRPDFIPAAVIAAQLLVADGRPARAEPLIEAAWKLRPHPALWLAWRDLYINETPTRRAQRLGVLVAAAPAGDREGRILAVEQALIANNPAAATAAAEGLSAEPLTQRLAGLFARTAFAAGNRDEARAWIARAPDAPRETDWSDIDAQGRAFAYSPTDWAKVAVTYAETGQLAHPRDGQGDPVLNDLPQIPAAYIDSAPFIRAAVDGHAFALGMDDDDFGEALRA